MNEGITIVVTIFYGLIFLVGLLTFLNPRFMWKTFQSWKATEEPSKTYFMFQRLAGLFTMLVIGFIFLLPYLGSRM